MKGENLCEKQANVQNFLILHESIHNAVVLGECSALWGEREGVVWCIIAFHSTTFSHLHAYISHNNSLIPRSSPPPTVACKTTGKKRLGKRLCRISNDGVCETT